MDNEIGYAISDSWAAVWVVGATYINVLRREFYDQYETGIRRAAREGEVFSDDAGRTGNVAVISTNGDLDSEGQPRGFVDASEYVAAELTRWICDDGDDYEEAVAQGYGR